MKKGFTMIEVIISVGIFLILLTIVFSSIRLTNDSLRAKTHQEIYHALNEASRRAFYGIANSDWGVYFQYDEISGEATRIILYAGENYATRDTQYDRSTILDSSILFSDITLSDISLWTGNGNEVTFESMSGIPHQEGTITLTTALKQTIITIEKDSIPLIDYVQ